MSNRDRNPLKKDKDGNVIIKEPIIKKYSAIILLVFAAVLFVGSAYLMIKGVFSVINILRIIGSVLIIIYAIWTIKKREVYIITKEKFIAFGSWEVFLKDIDAVYVNKLKFIKILVITSRNAEFTVDQASVSVPVEYIAEYLSKKLKKK